MFAPHCSVCDCRVLLGPGRVVPAESGVVLRCFCGELIAWAHRSSAPEAEREAGDRTLVAAGA